jgi:hypothetical protein
MNSDFASMTPKSSACQQHDARTHTVIIISANCRSIGKPHHSPQCDCRIEVSTIGIQSHSYILLSKRRAIQERTKRPQIVLGNGTVQKIAAALKRARPWHRSNFTSLSTSSGY